MMQKHLLNPTTHNNYLQSLQRVCHDHPGFSRGVLQDYVRPIASPVGSGVALEVECGSNAALMLLARLCRGSSGRCIFFRGSWLTPNEFQLLSGRETAKDWKRSIRHRGRSMKLLLTKGFLTVHETGCECAGCAQNQGAKLATTASSEEQQQVVATLPPASDEHMATHTWGSPPPSTPQDATNIGLEGGEKRRENRLTSIIDQLRASSRGSAHTPPQGEGHVESEGAPSTELLISNNNNNNTVVSGKPRKRRGANSTARHTASDIVDQRMSAGDTGAAAAAALAAAAAAVKAERLSPGSSETAVASGSRSGSPESARNRSYPPSERGSPSGPHHPALKQMEQMMNRNYSDFMRSLAAKYNNSNPNDYFSTPRNGFLPGLDSRFSFNKSGVHNSPFPGLAPLATTGAAAATTPPAGREDSKGKAAHADSPLSIFHQPSSAPGSAGASQPQSAALLAAAAAANLGHPLGFPLIDMSSTQALLNMVRSASAQNASQLENYLKGANNKRNSDAPITSGLGPLDLSSAPPPIGKRPRLYPKSESLLIDGHERRAKSASVSPKPPPRSGSSSSASSGHSGRGAAPCLSLCTDKPCQPESQAVSHWTVDDVCNFVGSVDLCAEYVQVFRDQAIDGSSLPLLTEDHLTTALGLKLGPALKLRAVLARRLGHCSVCLHCVHCHGAAAQPASAPSPAHTPSPLAPGASRSSATN